MAKRLLKSFEEIPGPQSYPVFGTLLHYLPFFGKYKFDELHLNGLKKYKEFGPVVKEEIVPGTNVVWIFTPEDVRELFRKEGRHPQRRSHLALGHYRARRKDLYNTGGLLPTNGPEWYRLRSAFQKGLSSPKNVISYLPLVNEVVDEFLGYAIEQNSGKDFLPHLSRLYLEVLGLVAFDHRLESFSAAELKPESRSSRLMKAAEDINSCILKTDNGFRLWRYLETPLYKKLKRAHSYMESVALDLVKTKLNQMKNSKPSSSQEASLLEVYLTSPDINFKDVIGMSSDMLLAGIDTITYTTSFVLYHLATNEEKQEKLIRETKSLLPEPESPVTVEILAKAEYLKAVMKESYRMNPVSVGIGRVLAEDAVFSGYRAPKGTIVVTQNQVVCRLEEYFPDPYVFKPERWLKSCKGNESTNPYLVLPFGHGPRTCIARRLAEQNMQTFILKFFRNEKLGWEGGLLDSKSYLINKPDGPLKFSIRNTSRANPRFWKVKFGHIAWESNCQSICARTQTVKTEFGASPDKRNRLEFSRTWSRT